MPKVIYKYARFHAPGEVELGSVEEAMLRASDDIETNGACPVEIVDGDTVYDYDTILQYLEEHGMV